MSDMFGMMGNHEERVVENTKCNGAIIDTCLVTDSCTPYETGISHPAYNNGHWVIVEEYATRAEAEVGHKKWVETFTTGLPDTLRDASTCLIVQLAKAFGAGLNTEHPKHEDWF